MDLQEELKQQLIILKKESKKKAVLVEGKKDKKALEFFDIKNIITITKPLYQIVETISNSFQECILLLDLDKEGNKLYQSLKNDLQKNGIKINTNFRTFISKHTGLREIEGLKHFYFHINNNNGKKIKA